MANVNYISKKMVTPVGEAMWCKLGTNMDDYEGKKRFVVNLTFPNQKDEDDMKSMYDKWLREAKATPDLKGKKWRSNDDPRIGYKFNEELGKLVFTYRTTATRMVDGVETQNILPVFDRYGRPFKEVETIGNGSLIQVRFDSSWYYKSSDSNGLSNFLTGIVIKELKEYNGAADGFTFDEFSAGSVPDYEAEINEEFPA